MTNTQAPIHKVCAVCNVAEWDVPIESDEALADNQDYNTYMARIRAYIENCKGICPDCERRIAERNKRQAESHQMTQETTLAVATGRIWADTLRCTFALSDPLKEAVNADIWRQARELADDERFTRHRSAMLIGAPGLGKTYLARCLLNAVGEDRGYNQVCELTARQYIHAVIERQGRVWGAQRGFFLLLDDIDKAAWKPETLQMLWELLDMRTHGQFTAITTNLDQVGLMHMLREACP